MYPFFVCSTSRFSLGIHFPLFLRSSCRMINCKSGTSRNLQSLPPLANPADSFQLSTPPSVSKMDSSVPLNEQLQRASKHSVISRPTYRCNESPTGSDTDVRHFEEDKRNQSVPGMGESRNPNCTYSSVAIDDFTLPNSFRKKRRIGSHTDGNNISWRQNHPVNYHAFEKFDICEFPCRRNPLPHLQSRQVMNSFERSGIILRPGMILLKDYISQDDQVRIVKICRHLGLNPGGFYQPGYNDGAKLNLQMMCLGLSWDPRTRNYSKKRIIDGAETPDIPIGFAELAKRSIWEAHSIIRKEGDSNPESVLPSLSPDICIVNFYVTNGRLGLHQDRDESQESLQKRLPVVSFSIGDSAEFLYGDKRNIDNAQRVILNSGDVLIFGGNARHVFHGVTSIIPDSAPTFLCTKSHLRPGRLNLTFRKY